MREPETRDSAHRSDGADRGADVDYGPSPLQALREALPRLKRTMARSAQYIVDHPGEVGESSITGLARSADVSPASLSRLAARLGFSGFPAMRAAIATEHGREMEAGWHRDIGDEILPEDGPKAVLEVLAANQQRAARTAMGAIDVDLVAQAADWIASARRIHLHGEWADSVAVSELYMRLLRLGLPVWFHDGAVTSQVLASMMQAGDVALILSRGGNDEVGLDFCNRARKNSAHTVAITGDPDSALADRSEISIFTGVREGLTWTDFFAGRASDTLTTSLLWVLVAQRVPGGLGLAANLFDKIPTAHGDR
ncbi:MurR/RpiR family transcriptional regulator [Ruania suaedae]|uniref:MurR/RpiR family transcriptional regulator n=1 Tax=Ruania suaedae TaxID=2897774 RepID=UPI001E35B424|nr:MurR/RpiR family transcriptional regulator [Ruania suaedae]UFU03661.1 MurR/RpiR family transcriptional regulator [Ruania suaedae]